MEKSKKSTEAFRQAIQSYLESRAQQDPLFAESLKSPEKNMDDCVTYILNTVRSSGIMGFTDQEIYDMAIHYWDEEKIDIGKPVSCTVVVNHKIELTEQEKEEARAEAIKQVIEQQKKRMEGKDRPKQPKPEETVQPSLF